jgi:hypothetical protein
MQPLRKHIKMQTMHRDAWWQTRKIIEGNDALVWSEIWEEIAGKVQHDRINPLLLTIHHAIETKL